MSFVRCTRCGREYPIDQWNWSCSECGGVLHVIYDIESVREHISRRRLAARVPGLWKYFEVLPVMDKSHIVSLGEGGTFLHRCDRLSQQSDVAELYLKDETTNPTGSFIDRGVSLDISGAREHGMRTVVSGTSGNLAASLVAYAARAGLRSRVYLSQHPNIDVGKFYQIIVYSADVEIVRDRDEAVDRARTEAGGDIHYLAPSNPYYLEGIKTTIFEACEQLSWVAPDWVIAPMGNGGHVSMIWKGIQELLQLDLIDKAQTKIVGAQADGCAPIVSAFDAGRQSVIAADSANTVAVDIGVRVPLCGDLALHALRESGGSAVAVSDGEILDSVRALARLEGVFAEPASATVIAALKRLRNAGIIDRSDTVVCMVTGMGLKYPEIARAMVRGSGKLEHLLSRVERHRFTTQLGRTKLIILRILSDGETYGYAIWKRMRDEFGVEIRIPTVYQHLSELVSSGLVVRTRTDRSIRKTIRHYYSLSDRGAWTLDHLDGLNT